MREELRLKKVSFFSWLKAVLAILSVTLATSKPAESSDTIYPIKELIQNGEWEKALEKIETTLKKERKKPLSHDEKRKLFVYLGICFAQLDHRALAIESWKKAESFGPLNGLSPPTSAKAQELWREFVSKYSRSAALREGLSPPPKRPNRTPSNWKQIVGWTSIGVSVALLGVGIGTGAAALNNANEAVQRQMQAQRKDIYQIQAAPIIKEYHSSAVTLSTVSNVTFLSAGLVGATGLFIVIWDFLEKGSESSQTKSKKK